MQWRWKKRQFNDSIEFNCGGMWPFLEWELEPNKRICQELLGGEDPVDLFCPHIKDISVKDNKAYGTVPLALIYYTENGSVGLCKYCLEEGFAIAEKALEEKEKKEENDT